MTNPVYSVPLDLVTTALLTLFRGTGRPVFDGAYGKDTALAATDPRYAADPLKPPYPYHILYRIPGGSSDVTPDLSGVRRTVTVPWQLTTVSNRRNQCENAARAAGDRLLARTRGGFVHPLVMPDDWVCTDRRPDPAMPGIDRSGEHPNAVYSLPARYLLDITPS